jgi:NAD(P)-dependent dehydrogenase (short-subunit alcohol dehydrogenase family)
VSATNSLAGKAVLVTGASRGIGLEVARALAELGARVILAARSADALRAAAAELPGTDHRWVTLDVSDPAAWDPVLQTIDSLGALHGLVTAAGVLGPVGLLEQVEPQAFADAIAVNLLGTALALHHTLPRLRRANGRAVTFSGGGATAPLARYDAYAASKAAVVRLTENVAAAYDGEVDLNCVAPGFVATRIHEGTLEAGPDAAGPEYYQRTRSELERGGVPAREAAELVCFLLSEAAAGISGRLLSAQWDPWRETTFQDRLSGDRALGTLRRIDESQFGRVE